MKSFIKWMIDRLSYTQIYIFLSLLFILSLIPIEYFWVKIHLNRITLIETQLIEIKEELLLKQLFEQIQEHRKLIFYSDSLDQELALNSLEMQIQSTIQEATKLSNKNITQLMYAPGSIWQEANPKNIENQWNSLIKKMSSLSPTQIETLHTQLIYNLLIQFGYLSNKIGMSVVADLHDYSIIQTVFLHLPYMQENLSQLALLSEKLFLSPENNRPSVDRLLLLINAIESDLNYLQNAIDLHISFVNQPLLHEALLKTLKTYRSAIQEFLQTVNHSLIAKTNDHSHIQSIQNQSDKALKVGSILWDEGFADLNRVFLKDREAVLQNMWLILIQTLFFTGLAIALGLLITYYGTSRLTELTHATEQFANGNLSVRVPVFYKDQIGGLGSQFNQMAQKLEEMIKRLYEILSATTALSSGQLSTRIPLKEKPTEFDPVILSFNRMAETFETIINRLQQLASTLTISATKIASTSQEQESNIVEQEETIKEIAVTTQRISSTAKMLANTMNEVSQTTDETSHLAVEGKNSLSEMQGVMGQMENASRTISSKLTILNEKATNITTIITTISKVADQTNLLSLNASIEAEKAGEYGKSFAVIAREIRRLADQTAVATLDVEKIVNEMTHAVSSSVQGVNDFTKEIRKGLEYIRTTIQQLARIIEQVELFTGRFDFVNQGVQNQSNGAEQINESISQLSLVAQQTSQAIHQLHQAVQELHQTAKDMRILNPF